MRKFAAMVATALIGLVVLAPNASAANFKANFGANFGVGSGARF